MPGGAHRARFRFPARRLGPIRTPGTVAGGVVGYLDFAGNLDFCITIRTMLIENGRAYIQAGAGIVADSNPAAEYEETRDKARALVRALELQGRPGVGTAIRLHRGAVPGLSQCLSEAAARLAVALHALGGACAEHLRDDGVAVEVERRAHRQPRPAVLGPTADDRRRMRAVVLDDGGAG